MNQIITHRAAPLIEEAGLNYGEDVLSTLDMQFAITGGVTAPLNKLIQQYHHYADGVIYLWQLQQEYLEIREKVNQAEAIDRLSQEAKQLRNESSVIGFLIQGMERTDLDSLNVTLPNGSVQLVETLNARGRVMLYPNAGSWILYKYFAYRLDLEVNQRLVEIGKPISTSAIKTWGDLVKHALVKPGYICGRRICHFAIATAESEGKTELVEQLRNVSPWELKPEMAQLFLELFEPGLDLLDLVSNDRFLLVMNDTYQQEWQRLEYDPNGKWENYPPGRTKQHAVWQRSPINLSIIDDLVLK